SQVPASRITSQTATGDVDDARTCDCSTPFEVRERRQLSHSPAAIAPSVIPVTVTSSATLGRWPLSSPMPQAQRRSPGHEGACAGGWRERRQGLQTAVPSTRLFWGLYSTVLAYPRCGGGGAVWGPRSNQQIM